ncbi:MAG TPA: elongation factor P [Planctomycetota bacterium]|nr:elongation factor P [Planctomycetota bacterium]
MNANDLRKGTIISFRNQLWQAVEVTHRTPGNLRAFVQAKLRNLISGVHISERFASTDTIDQAWLDKKKCEYLYEDNQTGPVFMDSENYEQFSLPKDVLGEAMNYVPPNTVVEVTFHEGKPLTVQLPSSVELKVVQTEPGVRGNTVSNVYKPATVETGLVVKVPMHINLGDVIRVNTESGEFLDRVNK